MTTMPTEVRERILVEHQLLRAQLEALEELARLAGLAGPAVAPALFTGALDFVARIGRHIALENEVLVPLLREPDFAWGELRAQGIFEEHERHLVALDALAEHATRRDLAAVLAALPPLARALRDDMREEEATVLHPDLLKDDAVVVTFQG
jgi:hypothetical protein